MSKRCSCLANTTGKICRKQYNIIISNKKCCFLHARIKFNAFATIIQSRYRGMLIRRKMQKIFKCLPDDLQRKVIFYMRETYLLNKHHHDIIKKIIQKKAAPLLKSVKSARAPPYTLDEDSLPSSIDFYNSLNNLYKLHTKYIQITDESDDKTLYYNKSYINNQFRYLYQDRVFIHNEELAKKIYYELYQNMITFNHAYHKAYLHC